MDARRFSALQSNGEIVTIYDKRNSVDCETVLRTLARRWMYWGGRSAVLQSDDVRYVDLPFLKCVEKYAYAAKHSSFISQCYAFSGNEFPRSGLFYIYKVQPYEQVYFFDYLRH